MENNGEGRSLNVGFEREKWRHAGKRNAGRPGTDMIF